MRNGYVCDTCERIFNRSTSNCCLSCNLDVCHFCAKIIQSKSENLNIHVHHLTSEISNVNWGCNVCKVKHESGKIRFGCRPCDFDACAFCYFV